MQDPKRRELIGWIAKSKVLSAAIPGVRYKYIAPGTSYTFPTVGLVISENQAYSGDNKALILLSGNGATNIHIGNTWMGIVSNRTITADSNSYLWCAYISVYNNKQI